MSHSSGCGADAKTCRTVQPGPPRMGARRASTLTIVDTDILVDAAAQIGAVIDRLADIWEGVRFSMGIATFEGVVEQGQIHLRTNVRLPDQLKVFVIVPDFRVEQVAHVFTPRLVHAEQVTDFKMEIVEGLPDAGV